MKLNGSIITVFILASFPITLQAQESDLISLYSITEGYLILDTVVIDLKELGFNENSVLIMKEPGIANSDTGFIVIDRRTDEEDVMAVGKVVETDKTMYLFLLYELDSNGIVIKTPDPANVTAYEWNFLGFGNFDSKENAIILREYLEGSLEARGKKWYYFMIYFKDRKNESMQIYGFCE